MKNPFQFQQKDSGNIVRYRKREHGYTLYAVFFVLLVFLFVTITRGLTYSPVSIYTIEQAVTTDLRTLYRGIVTREEYAVPSPEAGQLNYYLLEGEKTGVGTAVYALDRNGVLGREVDNSVEESASLNGVQLESLKAYLTTVSTAKPDGDFGNVRKIKSTLESMVTGVSRLVAMNRVLKEGINTSLMDVSAERSGYILYTIDSCCGLQPEDVTAGLLDEDALEISYYASGSWREAGELAYRLVTSDEMSVTFPITEEDAIRYKDRTSLTVELTGLGVSASGAFRQWESSDGLALATVTLPKYGANYLNDRYISFKISESTEKAYRVPVSAITYKTFFWIPRSYAEQDGSYYYVRKDVGDTGTEEIGQKLRIYVYDSTTEYMYVSCPSLKAGDYLVRERDEAYYPVGVEKSLPGVYQVNKGYCIFRQVEILDQTTDDTYCLVRTGTKFGITAHDRIVLDASEVAENQIL